MGVEPTTFSLQNWCTAIVLEQHINMLILRETNFTLGAVREIRTLDILLGRQKFYH